MSVQTQSATLSAGRRLLAADSDGAGNRQAVQYVTRGNHLIATRPGKALGEELTEVSYPSSVSYFEKLLPSRARYMTALALLYLLVCDKQGRQANGYVFVRCQWA